MKSSLPVRIDPVGGRPALRPARPVGGSVLSAARTALAEMPPLVTAESRFIGIAGPSPKAMPARYRGGQARTPRVVCRVRRVAASGFPAAAARQYREVAEAISDPPAICLLA